MLLLTFSVCPNGCWPYNAVNCGAATANRDEESALKMDLVSLKPLESKSAFLVPVSDNLLHDYV